MCHQKDKGNMSFLYLSCLLERRAWSFVLKLQCSEETPLEMHGGGSLADSNTRCVSSCVGKGIWSSPS